MKFNREEISGFEKEETEEIRCNREIMTNLYR